MRTLPRHNFFAFTLLEMLVSLAVLAVLVVAILGMISTSSNLWGRVSRDKEAFAEAREAFDEITRLVSQATLNIYWGYREDDDGEVVGYGRESELHFAVLPGNTIFTNALPNTSSIIFQSPLGVSGQAMNRNLQALLNAIGYFVAYGEDEEAAAIPAMASVSPRRYRLYRWIQPSENLSLFSLTSGAAGYSGLDWVEPLPGTVRMVATNILGLFIAATGPEGVVTSYDTRGGNEPQRNQLPVALKIAVLAIDEASAAALESGSSPPVEIPPDLLEDGNQMEARLQNFCDELVRGVDGFPKLNCRIFTAEIPLVGARWSE